MLVAIFATLTGQRLMSKEKTKVPRGLLSAFDDVEADWLTSLVSKTVRFQFLLMYFAAGLYKANEGFMHPRFSCAPVYLMQILEQNLPASVLHHASASFWLDLQTAVAPALILIVELLVPLLMLIEVRLGCAFGAFFHWMIAITPPPVRDVLCAR